jgi:hypothetical protein
VYIVADSLKGVPAIGFPQPPIEFAQRAVSGASIDGQTHELLDRQVEVGRLLDLPLAYR